MKNFTKVLVLSFILMILSISAVNALELDDDMQTVEESAIHEVSIEEPILNDDLEEDLSSNEVLESVSSRKENSSGSPSTRGTSSFTGHPIFKRSCLTVPLSVMFSKKQNLFSSSVS